MSKRPSTTQNDPPITPKRARQTVLSNSLTPTVPSLPPNTTVSSAIEDRKSKFQAYFIPLSAPSQLTRHKTLFENLPELKLADHKIMAWNVGQSTGFDDDGERWAGRKVLDLLVSNEDEGLLCVVRWYGGVMLGPVRFEHIIHVAADTLAQYHISKRPALQLTTTPTMKAHVPMSPQRLGMGSPGGDDQGRLLRVLRGKDMTIESLRGMITKKKLDMGETSTPSSSPVKEKNYERTSVDGLQRLVAARDKTIGSLRGILKELQESAEQTAGDDIDTKDML